MQVLRELGENRSVTDSGFLADGTGHATILAGTDLSGDPDCPGGFYIVGTLVTRSEAIDLLSE